MHKTGIYEICKKFSSCFDDRRYLLDDGINSLGYIEKINLIKTEIIIFILDWHK